MKKQELKRFVRIERLGLAKFAFENKTYQLFHLHNFITVADQLVVLNELKPYSNCVDRRYSKFACLNQCFKSKFKLSRYYFSANEMGKLELNYDANNNSIIEHEAYCFKSVCKAEDCKLVNFINSISKYDSKTTTFKAEPSISDYWIQLAALVLFFLNLSFYAILKRLFKFLIAKSKKNSRKNYLFSAKLIILLASLIYYCYLNAQLILNYKDKQENQIKKEAVINILKPEVLNYVICVPVLNIVLSNYSSRYPFSDYFKNMTFLQLEAATDQGFEETVEEIYLEFVNKKFKTNWHLKSNVLFRKDYFILQDRCFQLEVRPNELKYQNLLSFSELIFKFKHPFYQLFILSKSENFNSQSFYYTGYHNFVKKVTKRLKSNKKNRCINYDEEYSSCNSQANCIDRCVNIAFARSYKNITIYSIIEKAHFTESEWSNLYASENQANYNRTKKECEQKFKDLDCNAIQFEANVRIDTKYNFTEKIMIYYDEIKLIEEETSFYKLLLEICTLQSTFYGLNVLKLLLIIYYFLKTKFRLRRKKIYLFTIYLACSAGLAFNTLYIVSEIINGELIYSQHYEEIKSIEMPEMLFCFDIQFIEIDENRKLTFSYLNKLTSHLNLETIFKNISYLSSSNKWITFESNYSNSEFQISTLYFLGKKCFKIKQEIEYDRDQFYFSSAKVLKIFFNHSDANKEIRFYFMTRTKNTFEFSKINNLDFNYKYLFTEQTFEITYYDKFHRFKNLLALFYAENNLNDANEYLYRLINNKWNIKTISLLIESNDFNLKIDEDLFEQFISQTQNQTDRNTALNYRRHFMISHLARKNPNKNRNEYDFTFSLMFLKKKILISNEDNFAKLILSILNVLSLWADISILQVLINFSKMKFLLFKQYRLFRRIEKKLFSYKTYQAP